MGLLLVLTVPSWAQVGWQYGIGVGGQRHALQDAGHSDLVYTGTNLSLQAEVLRIREQARQEFTGSFSAATLTPVLENPASFVLGTADRNWTTAQYRYVRSYTPHAALSWGWGGQVGGFLDFTTYNHSANNPVGYELSFSINPYAEARYRLSDRWQMAGHLTVPLVAYTLRPSPLGFFPLGNLELDVAEVVSTGGVALPNRLFFVDTRWELVRMNEAKDREIRLFYQYLGGMNRVIETKGHTQHSVGVSFHITKWKAA
ncbi:MAG TPA: hypothetical protein DCR93_13900 [Cytophagales bacterium]|nr:hypothetical protein [Cytophagales bacterium]